MSALAGIVPPVSEPVWIFRLSLLNQRRLANFRRNRRGYWSLWVFWILFAACLPAEFIANDRPLIIHFDGEFYFPVLISYPETSFGGDFETEAEYRDPFVAELIEGKGWILWPLIPYRYDTVKRSTEQDPLHRLWDDATSPPSPPLLDVFL